MDETLTPSRAVPPGRIMERELEARGWTQRNLAEIMDRPVQAINEIVRGRKQITPETALQLAEVFGTSAEFWINLESHYRLHLANHQRDETDIARRSRLYSLAPVSELIKRKWIEDTDTIDEMEQAVCTFLGINHPGEQPSLNVNLRRSQAREPETAAQIAWVKRVEYLARTQNVGAFERAQVQAAIPDLLRLALEVESIAQVPPLLHSLGIHFVIVPHLPHTYLDGAMFTLDANPVIALTVRFDRIDNFWFTLMHELGHIVAGHTGIFLDNLDELDDTEDEIEANRLAQEWLIEPRAFARFVATTEPYFSRGKIIAFAQEQSRHPGIILGRLHHEGLVPHRNLRAWLVKVRPYLEGKIDVPGP